jgi:uncharacterized protein (DUF58 family)
MTAAPVETIPLIPRRRLVGSMFGGYTSIRRGEGSDVAGSRPYQPGDHFHMIDWKSSARLSAARGSDEFIVRERYSEEMPRVVVIVDRRPAMGLFPPDLPWLHKPEAVANAVELLVASAVNQRGLVGYLDYGSHENENDAGTPFWRAPRAQSNVWQGDLVSVALGHLNGALDAPEDNLEVALAFLAVVGGVVPTGSFVFVVSDFLAPPPAEAWSALIDHGWDVVPVVVQDPVWEQSFPPLGGVLAPLADTGRDRLAYVRLSAAEAQERREAHEARLADLRAELIRLGLDPVLLSGSSAAEVRAAFDAWVDERVGVEGVRA